MANQTSKNSVDFRSGIGKTKRVCALRQPNQPFQSFCFQPPPAINQSINFASGKVLLSTATARRPQQVRTLYRSTVPKSRAAVRRLKASSVQLEQKTDEVAQRSPATIDSTVLPYSSQQPITGTLRHHLVCNLNQRWPIFNIAPNQYHSLVHLSLAYCRRVPRAPFLHRIRLRPCYYLIDRAGTSRKSGFQVTVKL